MSSMSLLVIAGALVVGAGLIALLFVGKGDRK